MLINIADPDDVDSCPSEEEYRLLNEITRIDRRLREKIDNDGHNQTESLWGRKKQDELFAQNKWACMKGKDSLPVYNTNMEYFSQIGTEEVDDDSLFDPHNNILAPPKAYQEEQNSSMNHINKKSMKRVDSNKFSDKENRVNNYQKQQQFPSDSHIKKEVNYAYKKDVQEHYKIGLPPKCSKIVTSRNSILPAKNHERKSSTTTLRRSGTTPQNLLAKVPSKSLYTQKQAIFEDNQGFENDPNQFKFHTFKIENQMSLEKQDQDKSSRKYTRTKNVEQDGISLQCTFKPTILKKSAQIAKSTKNVVDRLATAGISVKQQKKPYQQQNRSSLNRDRLEELSQPRRLKTQYEQKVEIVPTFRPSLSKKSLQQMSNCRYDVATRNSIWQKQKQQKIEKMRQQEEKEKDRKENCTYSPSLCQYKGQNAPNLSKFGRQGISSYFERLSGANKGTRGNMKESYVESRQNETNISKQNFNSKGFKKQKYTDAVKQLHSRIMGLNI